MPDLVFNENNSFNDNLEAFLSHMDGVDSELGTILRTHIDELKGAFDERTRRDARTSFNEGVVISLDELLADEGQDDEGES